MIVDRVNAARAMAKCIAFLAVGRRDQALIWFVQLARELGMRDHISEALRGD